MTENLKLYIDELNKQYKTGIAREHSYRPALKDLLQSLLERPSAFDPRRQATLTLTGKIEQERGATGAESKHTGYEGGRYTYRIPQYSNK